MLCGGWGDGALSSPGGGVMEGSVGRHTPGSSHSPIHQALHVSTLTEAVWLCLRGAKGEGGGCPAQMEGSCRHANSRAGIAGVSMLVWV